MSSRDNAQHPHAHAGEVGPRLIGALLRIPSQAVVEHISRRLGEEFPGLRRAHMTILQHIDHPPHGSRLTDLAEAAQMTKPSMGELVDALERDGYVERIPDPRDRRAKLIRLTERGWAAHERASEVARELQAHWAGRLGEQKFAQLLTLLRELNDVLDLGSGHAGETAARQGATPDSRTLDAASG